jgi:hypothetical protein
VIIISWIEEVFDVKRLDGIGKTRPRSLEESEELVELSVTISVEFQHGKEMKATPD